MAKYTYNWKKIEWPTEITGSDLNPVNVGPPCEEYRKIIEALYPECIDELKRNPLIESKRTMFGENPTETQMWEMRLMQDEAEHDFHPTAPNAMPLALSINLYLLRHMQDCPSFSHVRDAINAAYKLRYLRLLGFLPFGEEYIKTRFIGVKKKPEFPLPNAEPIFDNTPATICTIPE